jgi:hypothetical protein
MAGEEIHEVALPPGTERVVRAFVNGVEKREGDDYEVQADRVRFHEPLRRRETVSRLGQLLLSVGIGVYPKGDVVDLQIVRGGHGDVVRARPVQDGHAR